MIPYWYVFLLHINGNSGGISASVAQIFSTDFQEYRAFGKNNTTISRWQGST